MPCSHDTFESSVVVTARQEMRPEGTVTSYLVTMQTRCVTCLAMLTFELPPYSPSLSQSVSQAQGGTAVRLVGHLVPLPMGEDMTWTAAATHRPDVPPASVSVQ